MQNITRVRNSPRSFPPSRSYVCISSLILFSGLFVLLTGVSDLILISLRRFFPGQIIDLGEKLNSAANQMRVASLTGVDEEQCQLNKANKDASKATVEVLQGLMTQVSISLLSSRISDILSASGVTESANRPLPGFERSALQSSQLLQRSSSFSEVTIPTFLSFNSWS